MSDSLRGSPSRVAGTVLLTAALCLVAVLGLVACGGDNTTGTTSEVTSTAAQGADTTAGETVTSEAVAAIDEALVGKWHSTQTGETLEFTADGKMIVTAADGATAPIEFTYKVQGANVIYGPAGFEQTSPYSIDGDVLTMVNPDVGGPVTLDRVQ